MNDIEKSIMTGSLWNKYAETKSEKDYEIWKNWCNEFYPKKMRCNN